MSDFVKHNINSSYFTYTIKKPEIKFLNSIFKIKKHRYFYYQTVRPKIYLSQCH